MKTRGTANRADKERAYLLHHRPYSETSLICYFFTHSHGIVHILSKGARRPRGYYPLLQPGLELFVSWSGKSELKTLRKAELCKRHSLFDGEKLILLLYTNELLMKLLKPQDSHPRLYDAYDLFLINQTRASHERNLRIFEQRMFAELGYGLSFAKDYKSGEPIVAEGYYVYEPTHGFTQVSQPGRDGFHGSELLAMDQLNQTEVLRAAKKLSRIILHHLLESKPLLSHQLFNYKRLIPTEETEKL